MTITAIKAQVKNPERVSVYVDGAYALSLSYNQLLEQKIHVGLELNSSTLNDLKKASDFGKLYDRVLNFVMIRPRSRKEIEDYCWRKKYDADDSVHVIKKIEKLGYINDQAFAKAWVESRRLTKVMSERRLRMELKQKGITDETIQAVLQASEYDELSALKAIILKKRKNVRYRDNQKLMQYLARQGFGFDDIKTALANGE